MRSNAVSGFQFAYRFSALQLGIAGLVAVATPTALPTIASANDYQTCTSNLLGVQITSAEAASACAKSLKPEEVSSCTVDIRRGTTASATTALGNCLSVRRPLELASCVVDITRQTRTPVIAEVLDNCRRSLLPAHYAECVVGVSNAVNALPATNAMTTCIDASDIKYGALLTR